MTPPSGRTRLRGRVALRLAALFVLVGVVLVSIGAVLLARNSLGLVDDFTRVTFAEKARTVQFQRTGAYVGYFETPVSGNSSTNVDMQITDSSGQPVVLRQYGNTLTYDVHGRHGSALYSFTIERSGRYLVTLTSPDAPAGAQMAFGKSIAGGVVAGVVLIVPGALLVVAAIVLLVVGLVRRGRHKSELTAAGHDDVRTKRYRGIG